jgi:diadenosine tetraphosphate (Ap4A) HIT family hydrolase/ADP-ribose pyrophosphatase YjhB (NUDIX family)
MTGDATPCLICDRITLAQRGANATLIEELGSGYAVLGDSQFIRGYSLLLAREHTTELHQLTPVARGTYLRDMVLLAEAVWRALSPAKMNYAILGNTERHLHCHIHPRYADEPEPYRRGPITSYPKELRTDHRHDFSVERHGGLVLAIRRELHALRSGPPSDMAAVFCVRCGTALVPAPDPTLLPSCPACGWFQATRALPVALVLAHSPSGKIVYTRQRDWPEGAWGLVAGFVEVGETAEASALRELEEETGLIGRDPRVLRTTTFGDRLLVVVEVEIDEVVPQAASEVEAAVLAEPDLTRTPKEWPAYAVVSAYMKRQVAAAH